jgi:rare lipoprotein A
MRPQATFDPRPYYEKRAVVVGRGRASYYADSFTGRRTANGELYDPNAYTAAHRTLPFGSILRVTREKTGDWVLVRVNDRGPYANGRVIDLSKQAAKRLSMLKDGVVKVRVELLELGEGKK